MSREIARKSVPAALPVVRRREFLIGGSAALGTLLVPGALFEVGSAAAAQSAPRARNLPLAYLAASEIEGRLDTPERIEEIVAASGANLLPAAALRRGDAALASRGARVTILGAPKWDRGPATIRSARLALLLRPQGVGCPSCVPFHAWSMSFKPVPQCSAATSFVVPVEDGAGIDLELRVSRQSLLAAMVGSEAAEEEPFVASLILAERVGEAKLRRGVYALSLDGAQPNLEAGEGRGRAPALVFSVEYAS